MKIVFFITKTKGGSYAVKEYGVLKVLEKLYAMKSKLDDNALEIYQDIVETLKFLHTIESQENVNVPQLDIPSSEG